MAGSSFLLFILWPEDILGSVCHRPGDSFLSDSMMSIQTQRLLCLYIQKGDILCALDLNLFFFNLQGQVMQFTIHGLLLPLLHYIASIEFLLLAKKEYHFGQAGKKFQSVHTTSGTNAHLALFLRFCISILKVFTFSLVLFCTWINSRKPESTHLNLNQLA